MSNQQKFLPGEIAWIDLTVPQADVISDFYRQVTGWNVAQQYADNVYNMLSATTEEQIAIIVQQEETGFAPPAYWLPNIIVNDLHESISTCTRLGGKLIGSTEDITTTNYCVIQDPAGAYISLTTLADFRLTLKPQLGEFVGLDISIPQATELRNFYQHLVGWKAEGLDMDSYTDYMMIPAQEETPVAGICHRRGINANLPAYWLPYVGVADLSNSMTICKSLGGKVIIEPQSNYCVIQDPAGAYIALMQIDQTQQD